MKAHNIIDIIERFRTQHALQEERETQNSHASTNGPVAPGMPDENGRSKTGVFELQEVRVWTVAVPGGTEWSPPRDGRDRMVVTLGRTRQLPTDSDSAFPARWACVSANSDFKVPNENQHTTNFMIVEFNNGQQSEDFPRRERIAVMEISRGGFMKTLIVGAGALGGIIGARLLAVGASVSLATRNATSAEEIKASGLRVTGIGLRKT